MATLRVLLLATVLAFTAPGFVLSPAAAAQTSIEPAACTTKILYSPGPPGAAAGKVLEVQSGATHNTAEVQLWDDHGLHHQRWLLCPTGTGWFTLRPTHASNMCLDESRPADAATVYIYACHGRANQLWRNPYSGGSDPGGRPHYTLQDARDNRVVDIPTPPGFVNGYRIQVWTKSNLRWNQNIWILNP